MLTNCPNAFPFAFTITQVTPASDERYDKTLLSLPNIKPTVITAMLVSHNIHSVRVKYLKNFFNILKRISETFSDNSVCVCKNNERFWVCGVYARFKL